MRLTTTARARLTSTVADVESSAAEELATGAPHSSNPVLVSTSNVKFAGSGAARTMTVSATSGPAQRHRNPDCDRHRWASQPNRLSVTVKGRRRWQGHPDRRQRAPTYS